MRASDYWRPARDGNGMCLTRGQMIRLGPEHVISCINIIRSVWRCVISESVFDLNYKHPSQGDSKSLSVF